ncbi:hypothetical protein VTO73DRAFT_6419 [Trametes versicolor]
MSAPATAAPVDASALLPPAPSRDNTFGEFLIATFVGLVTDSLINLLIMIIYAVNTGLPTGIFSFLSLIFASTSSIASISHKSRHTQNQALVLPTNLIYFALTVVTAKLYANTLLAVYALPLPRTRPAVKAPCPTSSTRATGSQTAPAQDYLASLPAPRGPRLARGHVQIRLPTRVSTHAAGTMLPPYIRANAGTERAAAQGSIDTAQAKLSATQTRHTGIYKYDCSPAMRYT